MPFDSPPNREPEGNDPAEEVYRMFVAAAELLKSSLNMKHVVIIGLFDPKTHRIGHSGINTKDTNGIAAARTAGPGGWQELVPDLANLVHAITNRGYA